MRFRALAEEPIFQALANGIYEISSNHRYETIRDHSLDSIHARFLEQDWWRCGKCNVSKCVPNRENLYASASKEWLASVQSIRLSTGGL